MENAEAETVDAKTVKQLKRGDSLDMEAGRLGSRRSKSDGEAWRTILRLAFQSIGIIYGDIGTSPLYVYSSIFPNKISHEDDILGVLSLILYTITLLPVAKYAWIVLRATDNGDGGTFALYSLICRCAKLSLIPTQQAEDNEVSNFKLELPDKQAKRASKVKEILEGSTFAKYFLLLATMLGTAMVIGDGILTPSMSVLSAVGGLKKATTWITQDKIVWISVIILILLFLVQRFGTDKVGYSFAPIILIWFICIAIIGFYNWMKYDMLVIKALNPQYIIEYFRRNGSKAWISLGDVVLCVTGCEALFADVGHFSVRSIQISMCGIAYPSLLLAYTGQAAYLRKNMEDVGDIFFKSIPAKVYWPMFVVALLSAIIASQAMISGTFSIIQQSLSLGCFPRVKVVHTSTKYEGQVYIPEINYALMIACVLVTAVFRTTDQIGNAYGIAVVFVMVLTSALLVLIMIMIWKTNFIFVALYILVIGCAELVYLSSVLYKLDHGGYLPLTFAIVIVTIMLVWNYVYRKKYMFELENKLAPERLEELIKNPNIHRIPGITFFYSELVQGVPPIFEHYLSNIRTLHSVLIFVSIKSLPISKVAPEERFVFRRVGSHDQFVFRCVVRYGYKDVISEKDAFDILLIQALKDFITEDYLKARMVENNADHIQMKDDDVVKELEFIERECKSGIVYLLGEDEVIAQNGSGLRKRLAIDTYNILKRNLRQPSEVFHVPRRQLLKVGMTVDL